MVNTRDQIRKIRDLYNEYDIVYSDKTETGTISDRKKQFTFNKNFVQMLSVDELDFFIILLIKFNDYYDVLHWNDQLKYDMNFCKYLTSNDIPITYLMNFFTKISKIVDPTKKELILKRVEQLILQDDIVKLMRKEKIINIENKNNE